MTIEGMLGRKLGTTQVFDEKGRLRGVTAVEVGPCFVTQIRTPELDGYSAVQVGFQEDRKLNRPESGHLKAAGGLKLRHLAEFRSDGLTQYKLGDRVGSELFESGRPVDVTGTSKGRGFQGGVRRHNFSGGPTYPRPERPSPRARLHRFRHHARPGLQGHAHGGPHGRGARHRPQPRNRDQER